jgi:penicillin-binding protein 1C
MRKKDSFKKFLENAWKIIVLVFLYLYLLARKYWRRWRRGGFWHNFFLFAASVCIIIAGAGAILISTLKIPDFQGYEDRKVVNSTQIYDRTGKILLYDIHDNVKRTNISFEDMGTNIKNATVAIEDSNFYNHSGIRVTSIIRAALADVFHIGSTQGGSTITQQLVKNTLLTQNRTIMRKIKEWILAIKIDNSMPKEKILEDYLNENPYGGNIYGIEEASKTYFGIEPINLDLAQAAYLASIPQSPTYLSPYGTHRDKLEERKNLVLSRMLTLKFITQEQYDQAKNEVVAFQPVATEDIKAPHFVFFIKDYLEQKYGADVVEQGGLKVITTLDYNLQSQAEKIVKDGALYNAKNFNATNAGLVAIDPKTGQILTMVGSRDYFDKTIDGNYNIATAKRQPGSSFKPFIYADAFSKGFTPDTVLFDLPTEFDTNCDPYGNPLPGHTGENCYMPQDFDNKFRGPMTLRNALAQSINIPAVKLFYLVGLKDGLDTATQMGISTLSGDPNQYGLTLVIGGGEVTLLDMTSAYGVFANDGIRNPYTGILEVDDANGNVLEKFQSNSSQVLQKNTALTISDVLSDNNARIPTFGPNSVLYIPGYDVAAKTGTTNNDKDAWTMGYTPSIAVGVWVGNNDDTPMNGGGSSLAGPIWNKFMTTALATLPKEQFEKPNINEDPLTVKPVLRGSWMGNENFFIDKISGKLATPETPPETLEEKIVTNVHSILYWVDRNNITGPPPTDPSVDPQFSHWEIPVENWWAANSYKYPVTTWASKPSSTDNVHTNQNKPSITILQPDSNTVYQVNQKIDLSLSSNGPYPLQKIEVYINGSYLGSFKAPFNVSFVPSQLDQLGPENTIKVVGYDSVYNSSEVTSTFKTGE